MMSLLDNYTLADTIGAVRGIAGFSLLLFLPGSLLGRALDLFDFNQRSGPARAAWSVALSFALSPILLTLAGHLARPSYLIPLLWSLAGLWCLLALQDRKRPKTPLDRPLLILLVLGCLGAALVLFELVDLQVGNKIYLSVTVVDQAYRVGFTNALASGAVPPLNPFYHPGHAEPLRYYYFWYALCALCMKLAHITARQALVASSVWAGWGLVALLALLVRHFLCIEEKIHRRILAAVLLLGVTGADLLPVLYLTFFKHRFMGELEWWSTDQISSWMDCILWVPHHTASLISCMTAFVLLWHTRQPLPRAQRAAAVCLAGLAAASSFGLSIYVAAGFALLMLAWILRLLLWERNLLLARRVALSAVVAILLLVPYLHELLQAHSGTQAGASTSPVHLLSFGVREFATPWFLLNSTHFTAFRTAHPVLFVEALRLLFLVPGYALELGFYGVVLVAAWSRRRELDPARSTALFFSLCGLLIVSFLRSGVIENNDFGYRAAMLPCLFLLVLGTDLLLELRAAARARTQGGNFTLALSRRLLLLGAAGTAYQAFELRLFLPLLSAAHQPTVAGLPEQAYAARRAYGNLPRASSPDLDGPIQANTAGDHIYLHLTNLLYNDRGTIVDAAPDCGAVFGGDPGPCSRIEQQVQSLFALPASSSADARRACRKWGAHYLAAYRGDPAWTARQSWIWTLPLAASDATSETDAPGLYRIVDCTEPIAPGSTRDPGTDIVAHRDSR